MCLCVCVHHAGDRVERQMGRAATRQCRGHPRRRSSARGPREVPPRLPVQGGRGPSRALHRRRRLLSGLTLALRKQGTVLLCVRGKETCAHADGTCAHGHGSSTFKELSLESPSTLKDGRRCVLLQVAARGGVCVRCACACVCVLFMPVHLRDRDQSSTIDLVRITYQLSQ